MTPRKPKLAVADIDAIIDDIETPETSVTLCLKGNLVAEYERLDAQLGDMVADPINLAGEGPSTQITNRMTELRTQMLAHERAFRFRAVTPRGQWRKLAGKQPTKGDLDDDAFGDLYHAWLCEVVSASAVDPVMSPDQVTRLADKLSNGQWSRLANAAWSVNDDSRGIPFSAAVSVLSRSSGGKLRRPDTPESPDRGSLAGSPDPSPSTSTSTDD